MAAKQGYEQIVEYLVEQEATINIDSKDKNGVGIYHEQ